MPVSTKQQTFINLKARVLEDLGTMHNFLLKRELRNGLKILAETELALDAAKIDERSSQQALAGYRYLRNPEDPVDLSEIESLKKDIMTILFIMKEMKRTIDDMNRGHNRRLPYEMQYVDLDQVLARAETYIKENKTIDNILSAMQKAKESCRNNWLVSFGEKTERNRKAREMRNFRTQFQSAETPELKNKALLNFIFSSIEARETFFGIKQAKNGEAKSAEVFFKALDENGKKFVASALEITQLPIDLNAFRTAAMSKRAEIIDINTFHPRMK